MYNQIIKIIIVYSLYIYTVSKKSGQCGLETKALKRKLWERSTSNSVYIAASKQRLDI